MAMMQVSEIPRSFAEWGTEQVIQWLGTLQLSNDYSKQFRDHNIDGPALLRLNPTSLSSLGITDSLDRVKLLQQITTMQADLASLATPNRQWRGMGGKYRRFSDNINPGYRTLGTPTSRVSSEEVRARGLSSGSRTLSRPLIMDGYSSVQTNRHRNQSVHSLTGTNPAISGTLYSMADTSSSIIGMSHSDVGVPHSEPALSHKRTAYSDVGAPASRANEEKGVPLRRRSSRSKDKKRRVSRSMDKLWEAQLAGSPLPLVADVHSVSMSRHSSAGVPYQDSSVHQESVSVRLPDGPTHIKSISEGVPFEDAGVVTHNHTRLVEILRDENTSLKKELNIYYQRVCKLMRMEQELERVREAHRQLEESNKRRERLELAMRSKLEKELARFRAERDGGGTSENRKLERRDSIVKRKMKRVASADYPTSVSDTTNSIEEPEVYSQKIDRLRENLKSLQQISLRREELEKQVRTQLQDEIRELRGEKEEGKGGDEAKWETEVTVLQADLAKWELKYTELAAEKELAVEVALAQKESHIKQLKETLATKEEELKELTEKIQQCNCQLGDSPKHPPLHSSPLHPSPSHHSSPPHHQLHTSPTSHLSPSHRRISSPTHSHTTHKLHHSPPHQIYSAPLRKTVGSMLDLSRGCSISPSSSLINETHSDTHSNPSPYYLTNGGGDPAINPAPLRHMEEHFPINARHQGTSSSSPRHVVRRVKSKTPPPRTDVVTLLPKSLKYSSLDRGTPSVSHTQSELQLFNALLGDAVPGGPCSGKGVNTNGKPSLKGVNTLYSHPHGNCV